MITQISEILSKASLNGTDRNIQPTLLYNEGWLLRLILLWLSDKNIDNFQLNFLENSRWHSEALLPTPFLATKRGDILAESHTHCDGVIGNFEIGGSGKSDLNLLKNCKQFIITEAKIYSKLSAGTKNASGYNQAARTLACMSFIILKSGTNLNEIESLGFFVLLPKNKIKEDSNFKKYTEKDNVLETVENRVKIYKDMDRDDYADKKKWFDNHFKPFLEKVQIEILSWESIIEIIKNNDSKYGKSIEYFYNKCLAFNKNKNASNSKSY